MGTRTGLEALSEQESRTTCRAPADCSPFDLANRVSVILKDLQGIEVRWHERMSAHTTFRIGGPVCCLLRPRDELALESLVARMRAHGLPYVVLGGGSNILVPDDAWGVVAVQLSEACGGIGVESAGAERVLVQVGSGVRMSRLARFCIEEGIGGMECLAGIPGTVGGALVMNAGTRAGAIADFLLWVDVLDADGLRRRIDRKDLAAGYRHMGVPQAAIVLGACLSAHRASSSLIRQRLAALIGQRKSTQPIEWPSAGCIFKNPPGFSAGALIDGCGLKGLRMGDAKVSEKHANWIVNIGRARACDVMALIEHIEDCVFRRFGVRLEREIRILGIL